MSLSVSRKLTIIMALTSLASLFVAFAALAVYDILAVRSGMVRNLSILADMVGSNSTAALSFEDPNVARDVLNSLKAHPHIAYAVTYKSDGEVFATYKRNGGKQEVAIPQPQDTGYEFGNSHLGVFHRIKQEGDTLGTVYIQSDLDQVYNRSKNYFGIAAGVMVISMLVSFAVFAVLQRNVSAPLLNLARLAKQVSTTKDYSARAEASQRKDELGSLLNAFNDMLEEIEERDKKLQQVNEELAKSEKKALAATEAKSAFLANMSHELRTPLNAIIGFSDILIGEIQDEHVLGDLKVVNSSGKHLLSLINDILDLSKIEAGKMELYLEPYRVPKLVDDVVSTVRPLVEEAGNTLEVDIDSEVQNVWIDVTKLRQCLFNLLSNANKFTDSGTISLTVDSNQQHGDWLRLRVKDTGIGMSPEQLKKLFRPFTQADSSTSRKYGGTGLGLTISKNFCEMMGGGIEVASKQGEGTTFEIQLPYRTEKPGADAVEVRPELEAHLDSDLNTILVIDDDSRVHRLMTRFLEGDGWHVVTASDGKEGIHLAKKLKPDAITLDVMMPGMDGWSVLSELKSDKEVADIPVVMLSIIDDKKLGYSLGASDYLTKPISRGDLVQVLGKYRCENPPCPLLIVDDDTTTRSMMARMLENEGWTISQAADGNEALEEVKRNLPELILLDLMMPEMDGFEFLRQFRANQAWKRIPVVVITAKELTPEDRQRLTGSVESILQKDPDHYEQLLDDLKLLVTSCVSRKQKPAARQTELIPASAEDGEETVEGDVSLSVLLAEDNAFNQRLAVRLLKKMGHQPTVVGNGREAVESFETGQFDVILMDVQMPEMDGFEATVAIREKEERHDSRIPIIAMTAHAMVGDRERCLEAGMDDYLAKPIKVEELTAALGRCVGSIKAAAGEQTANRNGTFSLERLRQLAQGDEEFMRELMQDFSDDTSSSLSQLKQAISDVDSATARRCAHSIKGLAASIGAEQLSQRAKQIENLAADEKLDGLSSLISDVETELAQVKSVLQEVLEQEPA